MSWSKSSYYWQNNILVISNTLTVCAFSMRTKCRITVAGFNVLLSKTRINIQLGYTQLMYITPAVHLFISQFFPYFSLHRRSIWSPFSAYVRTVMYFGLATHTFLALCENRKNQHASRSLLSARCCLQDFIINGQLPDGKDELLFRSNVMYEQVKFILWWQSGKNNLTFGFSVLWFVPRHTEGERHKSWPTYCGNNCRWQGDNLLE